MVKFGITPINQTALSLETNRATLLYLCFDQMKTSRLTKVLELGGGHGRNATFFASNGIEVEALDYSVIFRNNKGTKTKRFELLFWQK